MALSVRYERDGVVLPRAIGGDAALDLVNTFAGWDRPSAASARDYLQSYDHLVLWSASVGMVGDNEVGPLRRAGRRDPAGADEALHGAKHLRSAVHDLLLNPRGTARAMALETVQDIASSAITAARLRWEPPATVEFAEGVRRPLDILGWHCLHFLGTADATRVRACPGRDCGWLFIDRAGRRRWCRMEWCGNRSKARAHARRRQTT
ncbi:MAG TPA: CGNR zinc finger domain-containing protein [Nocardioides sp.]|nr:CGNR zinc finger domain-containing protein [Nocardioides sp.]